MTHIASGGKKEVLYCFSRSSVKFQCHTGQKVGFGSNLGKITRPVTAIKSLRFALFKVIHQISSSHGTKKFTDFDPNWVFPDCNSSLTQTQTQTQTQVWIHTWLRNDAETCSDIEEVPYRFSRSAVKFQGHTWQKNRRFWPELWVSGL